jgi:hypothetical protein
MAEPSAVEVKVNIKGDVDDALSRLGLSGGKPRRVWFLDDRRPCASWNSWPTRSSVRVGTRRGIR